jgi:hypothetical protein
MDDVFYCVDIDFSVPLVGGLAYGAADAQAPTVVMPGPQGAVFALTDYGSVKSSRQPGIGRLGPVVFRPTVDALKPLTSAP